MRITDDPSVDAAYIYLSSEIARGAVARTYPCDPSEVKAEINLDFDGSGRLIGIEVLEASRTLPPDLLKQADVLPSPLEALKRG